MVNGAADAGRDVIRLNDGETRSGNADGVRVAAHAGARSQVLRVPGTGLLWILRVQPDVNEFDRGVHVGVFDELDADAVGAVDDEAVGAVALRLRGFEGRPGQAAGDDVDIGNFEGDTVDG